MIRFLIGELNINCSSHVMAVPSKVSTPIRVLSVRMAELNPILKNKRDAERQLKNFEDKLVLKNSNSDIMRRMANDTATMEDFEALIKNPFSVGHPIRNQRKDIGITL